MAVDAHHSNVFSQLISNRDCVKLQQNMNQGGVNLPTGAGESLSYNFTVPPTSTKRPRDFHIDAQFAAAAKRRSVAYDSSSPSWINAEFSQIQNQQQSEFDRFVALQTEKLRREVEARQQTQTRMLATAVQNHIFKKLKEKDDEINRIRNLNWALQERVKNLYVDNQMWRDIAQTNEANANNLRTNLEHVLAQLEPFPSVENDVASSCGSCADGEAVMAFSNSCKRCGEREATVLVLPCRHLCLCNVCGGSALLQNCPVCDLVMNASVHVNMS